TVNPAALPPVANFSANQTTVTAGQSISFSDQSTNSPTSWTWSFPGGTPANATVKNPVVTYNTPGTYPVTLVAANNAGNDSETKVNYITVNPAALPPVADFTSDVTSISPGDIVQFEDLSNNIPTSWQWSFPGGLPNVSSLQNPIIVYPSTGCFDVTLIATNAAGNHAVTKPCYINALTGTAEKYAVFSRFVIFPNPVSTGRLNVEFEIEQPTELKFFVVDNRGAIIRELLHRQTKAGLNNLAFNTEPLAAGIYYLVVQDERNNLLKNAKFIVPQ
ncbi:MAG TPA: PKD domain-containing protein, partial [Saprospiraceae bacterium]|nr:PKD domain-containing protein [Saprospiraceae bacterium]